MTLKKIKATLHTSQIDKNIIDTGYTVPSGKVFIVSKITGGYFNEQQKMGNMLNFILYDVNNKNYFHNNNFSIYSGVDPLKGFIFSGGERLGIMIDNKTNLPNPVSLTFNICGEEILAG